MQRLSRDKYTTVLDPALPPAITIASGEELVVETWDAYKGVWGADQEPPVVGAATGPIAVEGAGPGDALRIDILAITPGPAAMHDVRPGRGFLGETFTERRPTVMPIRDGHLMFPGGITIPVRPSIGLIATTPTMRQITPVIAALTVATSICKNSSPKHSMAPRVCAGGMLVLGDCHAVVGDGAVGGTGAECSAEVTLRITVETDRHLPGPRALTPQHFAVLALARTWGRRCGKRCGTWSIFWCKNGVWSPMRRIVC
jgi:amidase